MAVKITSISRINGPTCNHYHVVVDVDGDSHTICTSADEMANLIDELRDLKGNMNANAFMALIWAAWKIYKRGASKTSILNVEIG